MKHHWSFWLIVGGLSMDLIDMVTTPSGQTGGVIYGPTGILASVNNSVPGAVNTGELIAMVGAALMFVQGGTA